MVFLFRDKSVVNILFVVLLSMVVHAHFIVVPAQVVIGTPDGYLAVVLKNYFSELNATWLFICYQAIILLQAIRINILFNEQKMFAQFGYAPAMTYILLTALLPEWVSITPALLANFLLIWIYHLLIKLVTNANPKTLIFNIGLLVGVSILCYHPMLLIILVVLFSLSIMRPFKLQEWFCLLMGIAIPYYFLASALFLTNQINYFSNYLPDFQFSLPVNTITPVLFSAILLLLFALFAGIFCWQKFNSRLVIQIRKNWMVLLLMAIVLLTVPFLCYKSGISSAILCLVPFSAFISNAFSYPKRLLFPNLLFWLMGALIVYNNWQLIKI